MIQILVKIKLVSNLSISRIMLYSYSIQQFLIDTISRTAWCNFTIYIAMQHMSQSKYIHSSPLPVICTKFNNQDFHIYSYTIGYVI